MSNRIIMKRYQVTSHGSCPSFSPPHKHTLDYELRVASRWPAHRRVAVTEARRTAELVLQRKIEIPWSAYSASFSLDVLFAAASASDRVAALRIPHGASYVAFAGGAAVRAEVIIIRSATVTFVPSDSRLALASPFAVAL